MATLKECLNTVIRPFPLEERMSYRDSAVIGGFALFVRHWLSESVKAADDPQVKERLRQADALFSSYSHATVPERRHIHRQVQLVIQNLDHHPAAGDASVKSPPVLYAAARPAESKKVIAAKARESFIPPLDSAVQYARGVGPQLAKKMQRMGINTIEDLIYHFPRRYEDRSNLTSIASATDGVFETVSGAVIQKKETRPRRGLVITKVIISDGTEQMALVWFNQPFRGAQLERGMRLYASGKVERRFNEITINNPEYEQVTEDDPLNAGRIVPVYPSTENLSQKVVRRIIRNVLDAQAGKLIDVLPKEIAAKYRYPALADALLSMHFPPDFVSQRQARTRLAYEELFYLQLGILSLKRKKTELTKDRSYMPEAVMIEPFTGYLPFTLTTAQRKVMGEITGDLFSTHPMSRLIQGDVGSGKTVVAAYAVRAAVLSGFQGSVMAPTEILAEQHFKKFRELLAPQGIKVALLTGSMPKKEKEEVRRGLQSGEVQVLTGTHALIQEEVAFHRLGLVVIDEQHRFGVMQRAELQKKGTHPDMLVMTATPIPRTLALTLYGDLDISVIDELPPGRHEVRSRWCPSRQAPKVYEFVRKEICDGRQAYIVCPLIEESEKISAKAATKEAVALKDHYFSDMQVALLHGKMKPQEKEIVMKQFRDGAVNVLISTTVIEVGVDIPNASVMVILNADRFGMAQLHQLRGRVGRGSCQSYCFFIADPLSEEGAERMRIMEREHDGFAIAEKDLRIRGQGELYGTRQHGLPELKVADLIRDHQLLADARRDAENMLRNNPEVLKDGQMRRKVKIPFVNPDEFLH